MQASPRDPFNLERFVEAQRAIYDQATAELLSGRKRSHWMWFVFPQLDGLGRSPTAHFYAIRGPDEAGAYLGHPLLGPRLVECTGIVNRLDGRSAHEVFGSPDDLKFRSSMTLFREVSEPGSTFELALSKYFAGEPDRKTLQLLGGGED